MVAANDGTGGGAIAAFKAAGVQPLPPVTGNDATIAALQLIIAGDQYNTISKPSEIVAAAAAKVAVDFIRGKNRRPAPPCTTPLPSYLPEVVTAKNIKAEIFDKKSRHGIRCVAAKRRRRLPEVRHQQVTFAPAPAAAGAISP